MPVADEYGPLVGLISVTGIFRAAEEIEGQWDLP